MQLFLLFALAGCTPTEAECSEELACDPGSVCVSGECVAQSCATSDQCGIESYCGPQSTCVEGCETSNDCRYGDACDTDLGSCEPAECTDTHIDCGFGEFCSPAGECYDAGGYFCADCDPYGDSGECGGNGNLCLSTGYCGVTCADDRDCPSGFDCVGVQDLSGNIIAYQCYAYCWLFEDEE